VNFSELKPEDVGISLTALVSVVGALYLGFRGRAEWEPSAQDIPQGSQRLASLAICVTLVLILYFLDPHTNQVVIAAIMMAALIGAILSFRDYHFLTSARIYKQMTIIDGEPATIKILGAAETDLEIQAKEYRKPHPTATIQDLVDQCEGNLDAVWQKRARAKVRLRYEFDYATMVTCGTIALACAGLLFTSVIARQ
jgi:hypothetical protein